MVKMMTRRLFLGFFTVVLVSIIIFTGVELLPGDACTAFLERDAFGKLLENCQDNLGLDRSGMVRYLEWAMNALQGNLGTAANGITPITDLVGARLRNSLFLASCSLAVGVPLAVFLGIITGLWRDKPVDIIFSTVAIFAMTIPEFVSATILILVFSVWLGWLPGIIVVSANSPILEFFPEIILPVVVLAMVMTAHMLRMVRSSVIDVMSGDYIQMATLKGVPYWRLVFRHALPNALLPAINVVALTIAWLVGGVVVIEVVFNYPGLGRMMIEAISDRDLPVVQAIALIVGSAYVGVNLFADMLTMVLNPRLRTMKRREQ